MVINEFALWLCRADGIGSRTAGQFVKAGVSAGEIFGSNDRQLADICGMVIKDKGRAEKAFRYLCRARARTPAECVRETLSAGLSFVSMEEKEYPSRLRGIPDPPYGLWYKGKLPAEAAPCVAIVGARSCSRYGRAQAQRFARELAAAGVNVVSGMARGIDGEAGRAAAEAGSSFAVMGCGADICYPIENMELYDILSEKGGILSEYCPGTQPRASLFPPRNRIISGLADAVLLVEARARSGSLITVDMALEQGRDVYALPGRVCDGLSEGCNCMIRQGAEIVLCPEDILEHFFGMNSSYSRRAETQDAAAESTVNGKTPDTGSAAALSPLERCITELLDESDCAGLDVISSGVCGRLKRRVSMSEISAALFKLQLAGAVEENGSGYYFLSVENSRKKMYNRKT